MRYVKYFMNSHEILSLSHIYIYNKYVDYILLFVVKLWNVLPYILYVKQQYNFKLSATYYWQLI